MLYYPALLLILLNQFQAVSSKCPGGQEYVPCLSGCTGHCHMLSPCTPPTECVPGCQCPKDFPVTTIDENNMVKCIKNEDCCEGDLIPGCQPNACSPRCDPPKEPIFCTQDCRLGCTCPASKPIQIYGRDGSLKCITENKCPVCTGGRVYRRCGSACTPTCGDPSPICTEQCVTRCECPRDKPIWMNGKCVTRDTCPKCTGGQVYNKCGSACTPSCGNPNPICTRQCVARCECPVKVPLWDGESCLTKDECPDCPGGQVFNLCGSACTPDCEEPNPICILKCVPRCECPSRWPVWNGVQCITEDRCPKCRGGQVYKICGSACTRTCENTNPICTKQCVRRCECPNSMPLWNGQKCITKDKCPQCKGGQVFRTCGSACTATCENPFPFCIALCVARCQCPPEKPIWDGDKCITQNMCTRCPGGQVFKLCGSACVRTCKNQNPICTEQCVARCECPNSAPLWNGIKCITPRMCKRCTGGQVFENCGSACTRTCDNKFPICTKQCVARCQCPKDKPFWDGNRCIDNNECDCRLPADKGPCVLHTMRWYYNYKHMRCEQFSYGGCFGNVNNFLCEKDCHKKCDKTGCRYKDCSTSFCPAEVKLSKGCRNKKCQCNCPCKAIKCEKGYECVSVRNSNCKKPPCPFVGKCVEKVCKYGSPLTGATCNSFLKCPSGYICIMSQATTAVALSLPVTFKRGYCCAADTCQLPPDSGCGKKQKMRWYYDPISQSCKEFRFGGSGGNANNFKTKRKCLKRCQPKGCKPLKCNIICQFGFEEDNNGCEICKCKNPCEGTKCSAREVMKIKVFPCLIPPCPTGCVCEPSPCTLPVVPGPCRGSFPRYFFNTKTRQCEKFIYGGCGGNTNNFMSKEECLSVCRKFAICPIVDYCFTKCPYGFRANKQGCVICDCYDPCQDQCCPKDQVCQPLRASCVTYPCPRGVATCVPKKCKVGLPLQDGNGDFCCTNKIACPKGYQCQQGVCCPEDKCHLPPDSGPCTKYENHYYYDRFTETCKTFLYGGCGGNNNRFKSLSNCLTDCNAKCSPVLCELFCPNGFQKDENGCDICKCKCPPVLCDLFCPNGFQKDENGCEICKCKCPPVLCTLACTHGFQKDGNGCEICKCKCLPVLCTKLCSGGFAKDTNGCQTCQCKCPLARCLDVCLNGYKQDINGCTICSCI